MKLLIPIDLEQTRPPETDGLFTYDEHTVLIRAQHFYRPQRSCGKVMFSQVCVKNSFHGEGGSIPACTGAYIPRADTPTQCMLGYIPLPSACWDTHPSTQCMLGYTPSYPVHAGVHTLLPSASWDTPTPTATAADGTHPTGMYSC